MIAVFSAYSVVEVFPSNGQCTTATGSSISLDGGPLSVALQTASNISEAQALQVAETTFISNLGLVSCSVGAQSEVPLTPVGTSRPIQITVAASSTIPTITPANSSSTGLSKGPKIAVAVAVPFGGIVIFALGILLLRRRRQNQGYESHDWLSFFQQKSELSGEAARHEMPADERIPEVSGDARIHEMPTGERRQELKGDDRSQELEVSR